MDTSNIHYLPEIWMELKDRELLVELMEIQRVSARELAKVAGWKSHSYMNRLISGAAKTLKSEPALRIAYHLQVPAHRLFVTRVSGDAAQTDRSGRAA